MTRFVLRNGDVFTSDRDPSDFDTFCYRKDQQEQTCHLLSPQSEVAFLIQLGEDHNLRYEPVEKVGRAEVHTCNAVSPAIHPQEKFLRRRERVAKQRR